MTAANIIPGSGDNPRYQKVFSNLIDESNNIINSSNPLPTQVLASSSDLTVINAIETSSYDLNAAPYSQTTNITNDYILDSLLINFTTTETKTISVYDSDGTLLWGGNLDTSANNLGYNTTKQNFNLVFDQAFNAGTNITVYVTQTSGACLLYCTLKIKQGGQGLTGNPILDASSKTQLVDSDGTVLELESNGAVPVNLQDQHSTIVEVFACQFLNSVTLASTVTIDTNTATFVAGHNIQVGNTVCFKEGTNFTQMDVINVSGDDITFDCLFDYAYTASATVSRSNKNLAVDGSSTPVIFRVTPIGTTNQFDITRLHFQIMDGVSMDANKFGGISALTKGILVRKKDGIYKNIFNAKTNGDIILHCQDSQYDDRASGSGQYLFFANKAFGGQINSGVTIRLDYATNDEIQIIVQDDLTDLSNFYVMVQGHVVTN